MKIYTAEDIKRFYSYVAVGKPDECWLWIGYTVAAYGKERASFWFNRKPIAAARFIFWFTTGIWPGKLLVCHSCDNKMCVNPKHLWLGTQKDNMQDAAKKGRLGKIKLTADEVCENTFEV